MTYIPVSSPGASSPSTSPPPANWYPDPQEPSRQRWWDGGSWTAETRALPLPEFAAVVTTGRFTMPDFDAQPLVRSATAAYSRPTIPSYGDPTDSRRPGPPTTDPYRSSTPAGGAPLAKNTPATVGMVLAIISVLVNPFLLLGIAAFILGFIGLRRSSRMFPRVGWAYSIVAMIVGVAGTIIGVIVITLTVSTLLSSPAFQAAIGGSPYIERDVEIAILEGVEQQTDAVLEFVDCPTLPDASAGSEFQCRAETTDGHTFLVDVRLEDDAGSFAWQVAG